VLGGRAKTRLHLATCVACGLALVVCAACGTTARATRARCTSLLRPGADVAAAIRGARPGSVICLGRGRFGELQLGPQPVDPARLITIRSQSGWGATIAGMSLREAHRLRFTQLNITGVVRFAGHDSDLEFARDRVGEISDLRVTRASDPGGQAAAIALTSHPPLPNAAVLPVGPKAQRDCFRSPVACGLPDPAAGNVGADCSELPDFDPASPPPGTYFNGSNLLEISDPHTVVANLAFPSTMAIQLAPGSSGSTLDNICLLTDGGGVSGSTAVQIAPGVTGTVIENSTLGGANATTRASDQAITNDAGNADTAAVNDVLYNCGECVHGAWTLVHSFVDVTASIPGEHYEDWYFSDATISANQDVFLNPREQTADIFGDTEGGNGGAADNHITITNSLLAGGGFMLYADSSSSSVGSSTMKVMGNRFARCRSGALPNSATGGVACSGGTDGLGYWPRGGYFGIDSQTYCTGPGQLWAQNVWDDDNARLECAAPPRP
jgi:hypothetical protein